MCTPQLKAQAATLQGAASLQSAGSNPVGDAVPAINPMRRQVLALAPFALKQDVPPTKSRSAMVAGDPQPLASGLGHGPRNFDGLRELEGRSAVLRAGGLSAVNPVARLTEAPTEPVGLRVGAPTSESLAANASSPRRNVSAAITNAAPTDWDGAGPPSVDSIRRARDAARKSKAWDPDKPDGRPFIPEYRTRPDERAFLMSVEGARKPVPPYPDGTPGTAQFSSQERAAMRAWVGYLYTLPEVKAVLDVLSTTEGTAGAGYLRGHYGSHRDFTDRELDVYEGLKRDATGLKLNRNFPPVGRYQIQPDMYGENGSSIYGRTDFRPVTQDIVAITALVRNGVIDKLLAGDLRGAFSRASRTFASIPMSAARNFSMYANNDGRPHTGDDVAVKDRQPTADFDGLVSTFQARLQTRRAEMDRARHDWQTKRAIPFAFISPFRWRQFGRSDF